MTNPFSGIISSDFKQLFNNAISSLLYNDALTLPCTLHYGVTKYNDCGNCVFDPIGNKSSNKFQSGGSVPFPFGSICPMCGGNGKTPVETTEDINLMVIWNTKEFINFGTVNDGQEDMIQTVTFDENTPKLVRAKELIVATDIAGYARHRFERDSMPKPCGLGNTSFVECIWKRSG